MDADIYQMTISRSNINPFKRYLEYLHELNELTPEEVSLVARAAYRLGLRYGRLGYYYFKRGINSSGDTMIVLLNCAAQINSNARILNRDSSIER